MEKDPKPPYNPNTYINAKKGVRDVEMSIEYLKRKKNIEIPVHIFHLEQLINKYILFSAEYRRRKSIEEQITATYESACKQIESNTEAQKKLLYF